MLIKGMMGPWLTSNSTPLPVVYIAYKGSLPGGGEWLATHFTPLGSASVINDTGMQPLLARHPIKF